MNKNKKVKLLSIFRITAGILCFTYYGLMLAILGSGYWFSHIWFVLGVAILILPILKKLFLKLPQILKVLTAGAFILIMSSFVVIEGLIIKESLSSPSAAADYIIVLGAKVNGEIPSTILRQRIDSAAQYMKDNPETIAVASGGQGPDEEMPEGLAIKNGLIRAGISEDRILLEDKSTSTFENLSFSMKLIDDPSSNIVIASSDFHIYRALSMAKNMGFTQASGLPAQSHLHMKPQYYLREYCGCLFMFLLTEQ